ncbi:MAG TPA: peptide ABC transporter substrate-binding protein [Anaerolineales bacterium]|nr:peptide ABC transporter substrate-binding protein [Anaerolineales bacterium]
MRTLRWQILIAVGGLILVVGLLIGQAPSGPDVAPQPVKGGAYVEGLIGHIVRLNPLLDFSNQVDRDIDRILYRGLVQFDSQGLPQPDLAEGWTVSADATLYTFTLRADARWQDGISVTSDDVVFTFSEIQDDDFPGPADLHELWKGINIIRLDDRTVQFQLSEPFAPFLDYVAQGLLPDHLLRGAQVEDLIDHPFNLEPVGTGAFRFDRFLVNGSDIIGVSLVPWEEFYGDRPYLERVEFRTYPDEAAALSAYQSGEVAGISRLEGDVLQQALALPSLDVYAARIPRAGIVFLNLKNPEKAFMADKQVRQALLMATNRQWLIDSILGGQAIPATGPILPGTWAYSSTLEPWPFDPVRAAQVLEDRGYVLPVGATPGTPEYVRAKEEERLEFTLVFPDEAPYDEMAGLLRQNWAAIGVQVELKPVPPDEVLTDYLEKREFEAALTELDLSPYPDPDPYPFWHDTQIEGGQNYGGFDDRNSSIWLERARTISDAGRRAEFYQSFQHRFRDQVPALVLYYRVYSYGLDAALQGVSVGPLNDPSDRLRGLASWYLVARREAAPAP